MNPTVGQQVRAELMNVSLTVKKRLGEGGQGVVYLVAGSAGTYAVKWYNREQATAAQRMAIRELVESGPPGGAAGRRFVWPLDLVTADHSPLFGYLMPLIDMTRFAGLGEVQARIKPPPGYAAYCAISYQAANSYRALHLSGHCYRDISAGNLLFDPRSGDVLICDNDNVGINRQSSCQVCGTPEFMAPELVLGEAVPSTETDLHSLAVLLFNLWVWHHPLHGEMEYQFRSWDWPAKRRVYGQTPVFIFDPVDGRNRLPSDPDYATARKRWEQCPSVLRELFTRAFTVGLKEPARRVTELAWQNLFRQLTDGVIACPGCRAENLWEPGQTALGCWHCGQPIAIPPRLVIARPEGKHYVVLVRDARILRRQLKATEPEEEEAGVVGQVVQNPANPQVWGIRNLTQTPWTATLPDGSVKEIAPQKAVPLNPGLKLNVGGTSAEIVA